MVGPRGRFSNFSVLHIRAEAISTGIYGFPPERAAKIAIREVHEHAEGVEVVFVCFDSETHGFVQPPACQSRERVTMSEIEI
jgi:O-acetyl-ADP-ribose deacetylase (regulator of RNase III)